MAFHQQATTLNVAVNASNKALLTIMMSNNVSYTVRQCPSMQSILVSYGELVHDWTNKRGSRNHLGVVYAKPSQHVMPA